jgi:hypothetical protein
MHYAQAIPLGKGEKGQALFMHEVATTLRQPDQGHAGFVAAVDQGGALFYQASLGHPAP